MIPLMNASSVLPPFTGDSPDNRAMMSPYEADIHEFITRFATTSERITILRGLLSYRKALRTIGIIDGWQWMDGSFVEDVEAVRHRAPADIDVVTFSRVPATGNQKCLFVEKHMDLFNPIHAKALYKCDAYFVDLDNKPELLVNDTQYWFGLFSHQRDTSLWKGMIKVSMQAQSDDDSASAMLDQLSQKLVGEKNAQET